MQPDWLYCNLAKQLLQNKDIAEAIEICQQGIQIYPDFYPLYYTLGDCFAAQDKWTQAISYYRKVQELNPDWREIEQDLNHALYQKSLARRLINNQQYQSASTAQETTSQANQEIVPDSRTTRNDGLAKLNKLDINLLSRKLETGALNLTSCQSLWDDYQGNKLILNYGCWLSPNILYLEATPDSDPVVNQADILVVSPHKYGIAQANFFAIPPQQLAGVVCFDEDLYLEDFDSYNLYVKYNDNPVLVEGKVYQKAFDLEFIEHLKTKNNLQKHLIRESVSRSIINLIPEHFKPTAQGFLQKIQYFLDLAPSNYVDPNLPFKIFIDYIIPLKYDGLFITGWLQDAYQLLEEITIISALGFSLKLSSQDIYQLERRDVQEFLRHTRYGDFQGNLGFCAYAAVPDEIRESIAGFAELHSFRFLVKLKGNIEIEIIPDAKYSDFYNARKKVMTIASPNKISQSMLTNCLAPVGLKLQQLCMEQVKIKEQTVIGTPVTEPLVSIIIPLYRRLDFMKIQLATMANDPAIKQCEIIYVLDSPEQEEEVRTLLLEHCALYQLSVKLIVMEQNSGYAAANNAGASQALGKYLVLLNSDVFAQTKGWMLKMQQFYAGSPKIGVLGAKLIYEDGSLQHAGMFFAQTTHPFWLTLHYYKGLPSNYNLAQKTRAVPAVTGACLMIEKELYDMVGGLTTDYVIGDFEDSDLCFKCRALGYESWYFADATLYHLERQSVPLNSSYHASLAWQLNGHLHQERWGEEIANLMEIYQ
ncbi:MAG: glycosyltransferase [Xenococcus sp. (in: cyanobacteria)]